MSHSAGKKKSTVNITDGVFITGNIVSIEAEN